jgi:hypothetical protein
MDYVNPLPPPPLMLSMAEISTTYVAKSSKCLALTCCYIEHVPKDLLYEITFFVFFSIKVGCTT